ncbi:S9 family peptidase [Rhodoblastus acidophilus]|uniref:S9 family peptidase n=1 Tax=Candidatus Rhodoblastus alkanivorans TaxID=2954117 RepID=A0ABS9Z852_9HYPH|nr:S9 family peptidase [Candidatus Rhodoblastus alkanivorans]MCI4677983.1 S9 family peptidase [Candidatus Rhodoblastus alkanivorans]MCI4683878.1 S9 family peptidase [Candidatus Rhodoblastus alkanivorans]MDI4641196.1 S9 family peptidase [Rhodoblastus acidophilus]
MPSLFAKTFLSQAPRAERRPRRFIAHGVELIDDYAWIRADNWREAIRDPAALPQEIRALLEAENAYAESMLGAIEPLAEKIYAEMVARVDETDCDPPARDGDWLYYRRFRAEGQHELICRKGVAGGPEQVLLDGDKLSEGKDFFSLGDAVHSPDHRLLAFACDERGNELHRLYWRDLASGALGTDVVEDSDGTIVWTRDSSAFLYTRMDKDFRSSSVFLHRLGADPASDRLIFAEKDPAWFVHLRASRSRRFGIVQVSDHDCAENWLVDLDRPEAPARLVLPRRAGLRYDVEPGRDRLFMRTNADGASDYKLMSAPFETLDAKDWREEEPHRPGRMIFNATVFADYLVWLEREDCAPTLAVKRLGGGEHRLHFAAPCHHLRLQSNFEFEQPILRFSYSSLAEPEEIFDYDLAARERTLLKRQNVPSGHHAADYETRLVFAPAPDGEKIPVSMVWRRDRKPGPLPMLLYGYGAYGVALPDSFDESRFSLIDRGFIYAIAHVRGGTEKGSRWYEAGKLEHKTNSFTDFIACARHLCELGLTEPGRIVAEGGSAGGLLMGAVANMAPDLFGGIIAEVPFVDVVNTICDASLPLTPPEWHEWGNPIEDAEVFRRLLSYSPYDNVNAQGYPPILIEAGLTDPRVTYWEPAKWAQVLRERMTGGGPILLKTNMEAGHGGASGRFDELEESALRQAFAIAAVGADVTV